MATDNNSSALMDTIVAANDFRVVRAMYKVVSENGDFPILLDRFAAGIAYSQPNSGQHLSILRHGIAKAYIGAAVTSKGLSLRVAASGFLIPTLSGDLGVAKVLQTCASGDLARVFVDFVRGSVPSA